MESRRTVVGWKTLRGQSEILLRWLVQLGFTAESLRGAVVEVSTTPPKNGSARNLYIDFPETEQATAFLREWKDEMTIYTYPTTWMGLAKPSEWYVERTRSQRRAARTPEPDAELLTKMREIQLTYQEDQRKAKAQAKAARDAKQAEEEQRRAAEAQLEQEHRERKRMAAEERRERKRTAQARQEVQVLVGELVTQAEELAPKLRVQAATRKLRAWMLERALARKAQAMAQERDPYAPKDMARSRVPGDTEPGPTMGPKRTRGGAVYGSQQPAAADRPPSPTPSL
jgi:hypothetical protein